MFHFCCDRIDLGNIRTYLGASRQSSCAVGSDGEPGVSGHEILPGGGRVAARAWPITDTLGDLQYGYNLNGRRNGLGGSYARTGLPVTFSGTYNSANWLGPTRRRAPSPRRHCPTRMRIVHTSHDMNRGSSKHFNNQRDILVIWAQGDTTTPADVTLTTFTRRRGLGGPE